MKFVQKPYQEKVQGHRYKRPCIISQLARAQADEGKYLVILSDMFEHRIDEISVSKIDLSDLMC